ncbi:MAG: hypothetical protein R3D05_11020 [Dongiaceae bacterium]
MQRQRGDCDRFIQVQVRNKFLNRGKKPFPRSPLQVTCYQHRAGMTPTGRNPPQTKITNRELSPCVSLALPSQQRLPAALQPPPRQPGLTSAISAAWSTLGSDIDQGQCQCIVDFSVFSFNLGRGSGENLPGGQIRDWEGFDHATVRLPRRVDPVAGASSSRRAG